MARIAVIIVNYGTAELSLGAVKSVLDRTHPGHEVEVHLVDNASPGGDAEAIAAGLADRGWQDRLAFYPETENHGFGRGNNRVLTALAARRTPPDYVFLLNPDAALDNEAIAILADFLDAHPKVGCAGAEIHEPGREGPVSAAFRFPGLASTFAEAINFGPISSLFGRHDVPLVPTAQAMQVDWVSGAAVMARFSAWQEVGFFDPTYFLYYEEVDLMLQAGRAGWSCWYVPEARVIHIEGAATGQGSAQPARRRRPAYLYASWRHFFSKNYGRGYAIAAALAWLLGGIAGVAIARLRGRQPAMPLHYAGDILGRVLWPLLRGA